MDEILINANTLGDQDQASVAGLSVLQFAVVWADRATGDIKGRPVWRELGSEQR